MLFSKYSQFIYRLDLFHLYYYLYYLTKISIGTFQTSQSAPYIMTIIVQDFGFFGRYTLENGLPLTPLPVHL